MYILLFGNVNLGKKLMLLRFCVSMWRGWSEHTFGSFARERLIASYFVTFSSVFFFPRGEKRKRYHRFYRVSLTRQTLVCSCSFTSAVSNVNFNTIQNSFSIYFQLRKTNIILVLNTRVSRIFEDD